MRIVMKKTVRLYTSSCTRTKRVANASEDLQYLRSLVVTPRTVTLSGKVQRHLSHAGNYAQAYVPMERAVLSVEGADQSKDVRTDASGNFELTGLKPGTLKLKLHLSDELTTYRSERVLKFDRPVTDIRSRGAPGRISGHSILTSLRAAMKMTPRSA